MLIFIFLKWSLNPLINILTGKTTLADALVASNGIISKRNAGKVSYDKKKYNFIMINFLTNINICGKKGVYFLSYDDSHSLCLTDSVFGQPSR